MNILNFNKMPRFVGNPKQSMIRSQRELNEFIHANNGINTCFTSVYSFNEEATHVLVDKIFLDLDSEKKPHNALYDAQELSTYCFEEYEIPAYIVYSGSKGYHGYVPFAPEWMTVEDGVDAIRAVQTNLVNEARLRTADPKIVGDIRRLCRIPITKHVNRFGQVNGRYCMPLDFNMLYEMSHDEIVRRSYAPEKIGWYYTTGLPTITEFIGMFGIDTEVELIQVFAGREVSYRNYDDKFVVGLFPQMCIHNDLLSRNPRAITRFYVVVFLKEVLGWGINSIIEFFDGLRMIDFDIAKTTYHVNYIYQKYVKVPACKKLRLEGVCVGKAFPKYQDSFK